MNEIKEKERKDSWGERKEANATPKVWIKVVMVKA